jgi:transposase
MEIKETIGIDVSKLTLDTHIYSSGDTDRFENNTNGFKKLVP